MSWLLVVALKNALLALPLAALALVVGRCWRRPALAHVLWAIVLLKLLTPPLVDVPVGWKLDVESWLGRAESRERSAESQRAESGGRRAESGGRRAESKDKRPLTLQSPSSAVDSRVIHSSAPSRRTAVTGSAAAPLSRRASEGEPVGRGRWSVASFTWMHLAGMVWLAGSLVLLAILARRAWRFRRFVRWAVQRDEYLPVRVAELAHAAGVRVPPHVIVVDGIVSPMLWGFGQNARLIFPAQLAKRLSLAKLDTLLLHELAHYARKDHWLRALELAACVLYWWNPLVWWARREIEMVEEECCDAWVVACRNGQRHSYAEALLTTVDFLCERQAALPPAACGLGAVSLLRARLTQIMCGETAARLSRWVQTLVLALGLLLCPLEPALWATSSTVAGLLPPAASTTITAAHGHTVSDPARTEAHAAANAAAPPGMSVTPGAPSSPSSLIARTVTPPRSLAALWATAISPNGKFRVEARTGRKTTLLLADSDWRLDLSSHQITCVSFAPDSRTFATGHEDALVRLWDSETGGLLRSFKGSDADVMSVEIAPDGRSVAGGSRDGSVLIWDLTTGDETARLPRQDAPVSCLRWSKRGDRLAIALGAWSERDGAALLIWTPKEGVTTRSLTDPAGALDWLADDKALVIADWDGQARIWGLTAEEPTAQLAVEKDQVSAAAWSPNCPLVSKRLAGHWASRARE